MRIQPRRLSTEIRLDRNTLGVCCLTIEGVPSQMVKQAQCESDTDLHQVSKEECIYVSLHSLQSTSWAGDI
jgi:hypothetical protein